MINNPEYKNPRKKHEAQDMYVTWEDAKGKKEAFSQATKALSNSEPIHRATASNIWQNIAPGNQSIKDTFSRTDYETFRPDEAIPRKIRDILVQCMLMYDRIGIVHNMIDLMADFACQGIEIVHRDSKREKFCKEWWKRVEGANRSERFCNLLIRTANVVVKRGVAKLNPKQKEEISRGLAAAEPQQMPEDQAPTTKDPDVKIQDLRGIKGGHIPWSYIFLNPLTIEIVGEELAPFFGQIGYNYSLKVSKQTQRKLKQTKNKMLLDSLKRINPGMAKILMAGGDTIPLEKEKIRVYFYKKDDWQVWAFPMIYSVMKELILLEKMKLADMAALDGAVSHIRVWKLGNLDLKILPTDAAVDRLSQMLMNNVGGGTIDLIWTPDLELSETSTEVQKFLGEEKYAPVLNQIYAGLGIPPTLTGSSTQSGFTNNFISLKTLIERLKYIRRQLVEFWNYEFKLLQQGMGWNSPPELVFDQMTIADDAAEKRLLIDLVDRNLISIESLQDRFDLTPFIEKLRVRREEKLRDEGRIPPQVSPWHNPVPDVDYKKIALQKGQIDISELGIELEPRRADVKTDMDLKEEQIKVAAQKNASGGMPAKSKPKGASNGRPKNSKDSYKRPRKQVVPRTKASEFMNNKRWADHAQESIAAFTNPVYLNNLNKKTLRDLTNEEVRKYEKFKFAILCNLQPLSSVDNESIKKAIASTLPIPAPVTQLKYATLEKFKAQYNVEPSLEDIRDIQSGVYALYSLDTGDDDGGDSD